MKTKSLLTWLCVVGSSIGLSASAERTILSARPSKQSAALPLEAQYAVSAALGKDQTAYHVLPPTEAIPPGESANYQAANPNQHFDAHFDAQGACVVSDGTRWDLSVQAWGYDDPFFPIRRWASRETRDKFDACHALRMVGRWAFASLSIVHRPVIPLVSANRVEYRRGALTEWYVNGPLGLQQGFTVQAPPECRGLGGGPLTFVLNLPADGDQTQIDADRTGLILLTDSAIGGSASGGKNEPVLRYSGLTAIDADGVCLPAWLETRESKLLLRVDDRGARYPIIVDPFIQQAKLTAADGAANDYFGNSMALSGYGDTAIAGVHWADVGGNIGQGAAYVFTRTGAIWSEQVKLIAADGAASDFFGRSVALSSDGDSAIVGAYGADVGGNGNQGAAYVFTRTGASWSQEAKLTAADGAASDYFGYSVALSSDGDSAIAGAYLADVGGNIGRGAAYVFTRTGASWSQQVKLTDADIADGARFGISVALSSDGDTAIVGTDRAYVFGNFMKGAAYVFTRTGAAWSQQAKLIAADGAVDDYFGNSVALSSDGDSAIAGAPEADVGGNANQGAAYIFTRSGSSWSQEAKLTAADGAASDYFGYPVALSSDGNTAITGAIFADVGGNANQGAAYVFTRTGAAWSQQEKLTAADGAAGDNFGRSVALSSDGNIAIVGAIFADVGGNANQGAAYVFAVPLPPTGVAASYDLYIDRVRVIWDAAAGATGYEVWRGASNDTGQATNIATGVTGTSYDDMAATAGTPYYYWVKTTNAGGASAFSSSAMGQVLLGPDVRLNGEAGPVTVTVGSRLVVTMSMNSAQNFGDQRDWWAAASTPFGLYYLNDGLVWTPASALSALQPVYQGGLFDMQSAVALDTAALPTGTYTFAFGVDTLNGILDPDVVYDNATVTVTP